MRFTPETRVFNQDPSSFKRRDVVDKYRGRNLEPSYFKFRNRVIENFLFTAKDVQFRALGISASAIRAWHFDIPRGVLPTVDKAGQNYEFGCFENFEHYLAQLFYEGVREHKIYPSKFKG